MTTFSIIPDDVPPELKTAWLAAKKIQADEWQGDSVFLVDGEQTDLDELREFWDDLPAENRPTWVWGCREVPFAFDASEMLEAAFGEPDIAFEDPTSVTNDLQSRLDGWAARWASNLQMDIIDLTIVVLLPAAWWEQS